MQGNGCHGSYTGQSPQLQKYAETENPSGQISKYPISLRSREGTGSPVLGWGFKENCRDGWLGSSLATGALDIT